MPKILYMWLLLLLFVVACKPTKSKVSDEKELPKEQPKLERTTTTSGVDVKLIVTSKITIIREAADPAAKEIGRCVEGELLQYLNVLSTFSTPMRIQGIDYDEPWLKAKMPNGQEGWVYAGTITFDGLSDAKLAEMVFNRRLFNTLGDELAKKLKVYQSEMATLKTLPAFRMLYGRGEELRLSVDQAVNEKLALATKDSLPDFFWLNEAFPGFLVHLVKNKTEYRLFRDFRYWAKLADQTEESADDLLVDIFSTAYQSDSIEYLHPDWRLALSEDETYSLLGRGIHKAVLDGIEEALNQSSDFKENLSDLKQKLLDDISFSKKFWEKNELIKKELDEILAKKYKILNKSDRVELASRRKMFNDTKKYKLETNLFEGGE